MNNLVDDGAQAKRRKRGEAAGGGEIKKRIKRRMSVLAHFHTVIKTYLRQGNL